MQTSTLSHENSNHSNHLQADVEQGGGGGGELAYDPEDGEDLQVDDDEGGELIMAVVWW